MPGGAVEPQPVLHPILACVDAIDAALKDVSSVDPQFMTTRDKGEALRRLTELADRVAACGCASWPVPTRWRSRPPTAMWPPGWPSRPGPIPGRRRVTWRWRATWT